MDGINLTHPLVQYVLTLINKPKTDLAKGHITNPDAIILLIHAHGMLGLNEIRSLSQAWKGDRPGMKKSQYYSATPATPNWALASYFGPYMGFTASHFSSGTKYHQGSLAQGGNRHAPPFFRCIHHSKGQNYKNSLSYQGTLRLAELLNQIYKVNGGLK